MKLAIFKFRRRRRITNVDNKPDSFAGLTGSGDNSLTNLKANVKIKKEKEILMIDQEGNLSKMAKDKIKPAVWQNKKALDASYFSLGIYLITPILVGLFLGLWLDRWLRLKSVFVIIFLILGTISSFYNLYKIFKKR